MKPDGLYTERTFFWLLTFDDHLTKCRHRSRGKGTSRPNSPIDPSILARYGTAWALRPERVDPERVQTNRFSRGMPTSFVPRPHLQQDAECAGINRCGVVNERVIQERRSEPSWPRVMRGRPRGCHRSVDRGKCRQGMELRNNRDRSADVVQHGGRQHRRVRDREHSADSAQSETSGMHGNSTRENRETPLVPVAEVAAGRLEKAMSRESNMHAGGESDGCVLPTKCSNNGGNRWRRAWREGDRPKRTSSSRLRSGL
jgi:hypothetical protein